VPSVFDPSCSARHALELISSKWAMLILPALAQGPMRNGALLRQVGGISQKMLTQTLKELERNGLVEREDRGKVPLHVEYRLSPLGRSLSKALITLDTWAEQNFPALDAARERFDADGRARRR
jgi:DNA-binding HxlR family transcriptional regulator